MNNYLEWSKEYREEAEKMLSVINSIKANTSACRNKQDLYNKIRKYKECYYECLDIANLLEGRYKGVM